MDSIHIRKAAEQDRDMIAFVFADAFSNDWKILSTDIQKVSSALKNGLIIDQYIVAECNKTVVGFLALVTGEKRAFKIPVKDFQKKFGFFKGYMVAIALKNDMEKPVSLEKNCAYIDIIGVLKDYQRKGIASSLIDYALNSYGFSSYLLSVTNINDRAINCYYKKGFKELRREKVKYAKQKGFSEYIYLKYTK